MCVAVDGNGNIFISDTSNNRVLLETPGANGYTQSVLTSNVTGPGGLALSTALGTCSSRTTPNSSVCCAKPLRAEPIPKVSIARTRPATTCPRFPTWRSIPNTGNLYGSDGGIIGYSALLPQSLTFASTAVGSTSSDSPQTVGVTNIGNASLTFCGYLRPG